MALSNMQQLVDHLALLEQAREEAYEEGNWDRVDLLGECISDTRSEIAKLKGK